MLFSTPVKMVGSMKSPLPSPGRVAGPPPQATTAPSALRHLDPLEDAVELRAIGDGADMGRRIHRITQPDLAGQFDDARHELVIDRALDRSREPAMQLWPPGGEDAGDRSLGRVVEIGIGKDDVGRLPAEFQDDRLQLLRRPGIDGEAAIDTAGEGELDDVGMLDHRPARLAAEAGDDIDDAVRKARLSRPAPRSAAPRRR